ncbi:hypothetical protein [Melittangium boletus]|uniref:hypothetical protein n=1 Tax=Melittangium boletus TaxID=83453 RepID=UPI003DA69095
MTDDSRLEDVMRGLAFADYPLKGLSAPVLRLDARGRPVVAWRSAERKVIVRRWEDSAWVTLMSAALSDSDGDFAGLQLDGEGRPLVAMRFPTSIELWRWDGTRWLGNGGVSTAPSYELNRSAHAALACRASGLCRVAWLAESKTTPGSVRMSLHAWSALNKVDFYGGAYDGQASLAHPLVLATNESGASLVSWAEGRSESPFVTQFKLISRTGEEKSLPSPTSDALETRPVLALSPADAPTVSWAVRGSLQVRQWKADAWSSLGERLPTPPEAEPTAFAHALETTAAGQVLAAWSLPGRVELWRWNGSIWTRGVEISRGPSGDTTPWPTLLQGVDEETAYLGWVAYDPSARGRVKLRRVVR